MPQKPFLAFACAHLTDERLYAAQSAALKADYECSAFAFRNHDSLGAMAEELLAKTPARFTLIGLSLGGYLAFEIMRQQLQRLERLVLMDTTAVADHSAQRAGRVADIAKVREGGIEALIAELPARWLHPAHVQRVELTNLIYAMASSIGGRGQFNQQTAMLSRPDSHADLERVRVPTLLLCGREDPVTPVLDRDAIMRAPDRYCEPSILIRVEQLATPRQNRGFRRKVQIAKPAEMNGPASHREGFTAPHCQDCNLGNDTCQKQWAAAEIAGCMVEEKTVGTDNAAKF